MLLAIGGLGFALTTLLGYFLADGITASMRRLVESLHASNEELSRLNAFQSKFFAMVAHDVKNPLTAIFVFAQIMESQNKEASFKPLIGNLLNGHSTVIEVSKRDASKVPSDSAFLQSALERN